MAREQVLCHEAESLQTLRDEIEYLDHTIRTSLKSGLSEVEDRIQELVQKSEMVQRGALMLMEEHVQNVAGSYQVFTKGLEKMNRKNVSSCLQNLHETLAEIQETKATRLTNVLSARVRKIRGTVLRYMPVITAVQNQTVNFGRNATVCLYFGDLECGDSVLRKVEGSRVVTPPIIHTIMDRLDTQLNIGLIDMEAAAQKVVNMVVNEHTNAIFTFIQCIL